MSRNTILLLTTLTAIGCAPDQQDAESRASAVTVPGACQFGEKCEVVVGTPVTAPTPVPVNQPLPEPPCTPRRPGASCSADRDNDGVADGFDCAPDDPSVSPHAAEVRCDGIDQNCDGFDDCDSDGDGVIDRTDCDPADPRITHQCRPPGPVVD